MSSGQRHGVKLPDGCGERILFIGAYQLNGVSRNARSRLAMQTVWLLSQQQKLAENRTYSGSQLFIFVAF